MPNKNRKCKNCGEYLLATTGVQHPGGFFHDDKAVMAWLRKEREKKIRKQQIKAEKQKKLFSKAFRDLNRRTLSWQHKQTKTVFNHMRVLQELKWFRDRGLEPTCISCGKPNMDWCCGHFKTVGSHPELRYYEDNTFLQCNKACNCSLSGNIEGNKTTRGYKEGLYDRFGTNEATRILLVCSFIHPAANFTCEQLQKMRAGFAKKTRELELEHGAD